MTALASTSPADDPRLDGHLGGGAAALSEPVVIPVDHLVLDGELFVPPSARGLVLFAHGSGSSRASVRNRFVAADLQRAGFATLLFDLLARSEIPTDAAEAVTFDLLRLSRKMVAATLWAAKHPLTRSLSIGYFGSSTGAAVALAAAAQLGNGVAAVVSRGGRPEMAAPVLARVRAPTLLIVGGEDQGVLALNRQALERLSAEKRLAIVPGATHLFSEPGALEAATEFARRWFETHVRSPGVSETRPLAQVGN